MEGIFWLAEELLTSQEGLCFMKLVIRIFHRVIYVAACATSEVFGVSSKSLPYVNLLAVVECLTVS